MAVRIWVQAVLRKAAGGRDVELGSRDDDLRGVGSPLVLGPPTVARTFKVSLRPKGHHSNPKSSVTRRVLQRWGVPDPHRVTITRRPFSGSTGEFSRIPDGGIVIIVEPVPRKEIINKNRAPRHHRA